MVGSTKRCDDRTCDRRVCARHGSTERAFERCVRRKENFRAFACACGRDVRRRVGKRGNRGRVLGLLSRRAREVGIDDGRSLVLKGSR